MNNYTLEFKNRTKWALKQVFTIRHFIAGVLFSIMFEYYGDLLGILLTLIFVIFCTYKQLMQGIYVAVFMGILLSIFPFLSVLVPLLILGGIISQGKFIWNNKYAIYLSIAVVLRPSEICEVIFGRFYYYITMPVDYAYSILIGNTIGRFHMSNLNNFVFFTIIMITLYYMKYNTEGALTAICMLPLLLFVVLIPQIISEISSALSTSQYNTCYDSYPGVHNVRGYERVNSSGNIEYVRGHIRTNPDGIESNNLSYRG